MSLILIQFEVLVRARSIAEKKARRIEEGCQVVERMSMEAQYSDWWNDLSRELIALRVTESARNGRRLDYLGVRLGGESTRDEGRISPGEKERAPVMSYEQEDVPGAYLKPPPKNALPHSSAPGVNGLMECLRQYSR